MEQQGDHLLANRVLEHNRFNLNAKDMLNALLYYQRALEADPTNQSLRVEMGRVERLLAGAIQDQLMGAGGRLLQVTPGEVAVLITGETQWRDLQIGFALEGTPVQRS